MLDTLYHFGKFLSNDRAREEFDDIIDPPPIDEKDVKKGIRFYSVEIIFNLDTGAFYLNEKPFSFDESDKNARWSPYALRCIKIQAGNNKSIYPTVNPRKSFESWKKTLFGKNKDGIQPRTSELVEAIEKEYPDIKDSPLIQAANRIFRMRNEFEERFPDWKKVTETLNWGEKSRVAMLFASIISADLGCHESMPVAKLDGYDAYLRRKFMQKNHAPESSGTNQNSTNKICYSTGVIDINVNEPTFASRYNLNKMFVTTTKNYASDFDDKSFFKNYQVSNQTQVLLERGSDYILKNLKIKIAGIDHCILPQFRNGKVIDMEENVPKIKGNAELLFSMSKKEFRKTTNNIRSIAEGDIYWITFLGYESDGNFFKTINLIKDISKTHFENIIQTMRSVDSEMGEILPNLWLNVMTYGKEKNVIDFNFYLIYYLIPVRKDGEKRNAALMIFKSVLERRQIPYDKLIEFFSELILCHRFGRYAGYNIIPSSNFDFAVRNAVFQYLAFFQFLKKIKLLAMEEKTTPSAATLEEKNTAILTFFDRMAYSDDQRALFYLGRVLNSVGRAQFDKGHKNKPILQKINYNGMDAAALKRLHADLFEKSKQYEIMKYTDGPFSRFTDLFKDAPNDRWDKRMKPEESIFYLLSGYSFRTQKEVVEDPETLEV